MARGDQILRHWNLLRVLQTRGEGMPLVQLSNDFGVSERTIQRDFEILQELGFPIEHDEDEYGKRFWRMPHDFFTTGPLVLGLTEAISLHLAERLLMPLSGTYLAEGLQTVLDKVRSLVPQSALDYFGALHETIPVRRPGVTDHSAFAGTLRTAVDGAPAPQCRGGPRGGWRAGGGGGREGGGRRAGGRYGAGRARRRWGRGPAGRR